MRFQKLDLEIDPTSQGFVEGSYDVVIAGNVLHATTNLMQTLQYVRKLLRPGGKLIMGETTNQDNLRDKFVFGLLPGWWLQKEKWWSTNSEYHDEGPLLTEEQWARVLSSGGFSGLDMIFRDHDKKPHHRVSIIVSTASDNGSINEPVPLGPTTVLIDCKSATQKTVAERLQYKLVQDLKADPPRIVDLRTAMEHDFRDTTTVSLLELERPFLSDVKESGFAVVKKIALDSKLMLWLNSGSSPVSANPQAEIAVGFGRTVCSERADQGFVNLSVERPACRQAQCIDSIIRVIRNVTRCPHGENESEYSESDGVIHIPRVVPSAHINGLIGSRSKQDKAEVYTIGQDGSPKPHISLTIDTPGLLDTLSYEEDPIASDEALEDGLVEVEVKFTSMNFKDVVIALGQVPGRNFGFDGAGVVSRVGPRSQLRPGDRVLYCSSVGGGFGTFVKHPELLVQKIPPGMSLHAAAAIPAVYCTVVYAFDYIGRLQKGESVLIHGGAGGVGQAAIQLAKIRGAKIFVTVGSEDKRQLLKDLFNIGDDHIFHSRDTSFATDVLHATKGRGVDMVLNSLGGELLQQSLDCIAPLGRFIDISKADILANNMLPMGSLDKNITFSAVDMVVVEENDIDLMSRILGDVVRLFELHPELQEPRPLHFYSPSRLEEAMRFLQSGKNTGKVVVDFTNPGDQIMVSLIYPTHVTYKPDFPQLILLHSSVRH